MSTNTNVDQSQALDLSDATNVACEKCDNNSFHMIFKIKKVSSGMSPSGQDGFLPLQTYACAECGHINDNFNSE